MRLVQDATGAKAAGPIRLAYCLNLHAASTIEEVVRALTTFTVPLRKRILGADSAERFGVGMYFEAPAAALLAESPEKLARLGELCEAERLDPFTFNAFPYGGFQEDGLKERVYQPDWRTSERLAYTINVARVAAGLAGSGEPRFLSISTHPGAYGAVITDRSALRSCAENMARAVGELARLEETTGHRIVLSLESEPDASARNARALAEYLVFARLIGSRVLQDEFDASIESSAALMERHLGACLDCCHSAVEFEEPQESLRLAGHGGPIGKIQFSSALRLPDPAGHPEAVKALLGLDEPRFLHQVTAQADGDFHHLPDLPALRGELDGSGPSPWPGADEWRCHFHVPVYLQDALGLQTTRPHADEILKAALADRASWGAPELHVEIETYTWSVLPESDGGDDMVDRLEREYRHVLGECAAAGYSPAG